MPVYEIEQYELHTQKYRVAAATEAEAIAKLFAGEAEPLDSSLDFVEVAEDFGMPADDNPKIADGLRSLGITLADIVIPSVRSIEEVEGLGLQPGKPAPDAT